MVDNAQNKGTREDKATIADHPVIGLCYTSLARKVSVKPNLMCDPVGGDATPFMGVRIVTVTDR